MMGINIPKLFVNERIVVDVKYVIAGILFIIASLTDFLDGYIARSRNLVTDFGKMIDANLRKYDVFLSESGSLLSRQANV